MTNKQELKPSNWGSEMDFAKRIAKALSHYMDHKDDVYRIWNIEIVPVYGYYELSLKFKVDLDEQHEET